MGSAATEELSHLWEDVRYALEAKAQWMAECAALRLESRLIAERLVRRGRGRAHYDCWGRRMMSFAGQRRRGHCDWQAAMHARPRQGI